MTVETAQFLERETKQHMKVLVTGGAGFIGSHLCDGLIARGLEVWCVDNLHLGRRENVIHLEPDERFHFQKLDVLDRPSLDALFSEAQFDVVFHLAANSDIRQGNEDRRVDLELTFLTTVEVVEAMERHGTGEIMFASTSAVFGETDAVLAEDHGPVRPISFYGAAKLASEAYLSAYAHHCGFRVRVIRFPNVVGERATHGAIYDFIHRLLQDPSQLTVLGDGTQRKPYLHVGDLVDAMLVVFDKASAPFDVYHVAAQGDTTVREMAEIVIEEMKLDTTPIVFTGGRVGWVGDVHHFQYDTGKIRDLGYSARFDSTEAIREAVRGILGKDQEP